MQTQCPSCHTAFRVNKAQLSQADGLVRCGRCGYIFNARKQLEGQYPETPKPHNIENLKRALLGQSNSRPQAVFGWTLGVALASACLLLQSVYLMRDRLADTETFGPVVTNICTELNFCELNAKRDLNQIQLVGRNVYSHPNSENALMVNAVITNTASFDQPYPVLLVSMSNVRGKVVAERYFRPKEYLSINDLSRRYMQPGIPIQINLELMDPGNNAIAFELDFF